jgi:hypothetical protein
MIKQFLFVAFLLCLFSCHNTPDAVPAIASVATPTRTDTSFFPVTAYIKGQMLQFDSMPVTPLHIITIRDKSDSQWIKREQLRSFLSTFLEPEITETNLVKYFTETRFNDQTVNAITLSYDPIGTLPDSMSLKSWNVYIDPKTGNVTGVFIVKRTKAGNQSITQQLTWENNSSAQIVNILNKSDGSSEILNQEKFIWNF